MRYKVYILPEVNIDIENFIYFLKEMGVSKESILKLNNLIYSRIYSLEFFPEIFAEVYKNYRRLLIKKYSIFYKVDKLNKKVIIYRLLHQSQNFVKYLV